MEKALNDEIVRKCIRYPWIYDTNLYDKFFSEFGPGRNVLSFEDVKRLLEGLPSGVFQVGTYIVGPFGLLESTQERWLPPVREFPLWHCPDPGCKAMHSTKLSLNNNKIRKLGKTLTLKLESSCAERSQFGRYYSDIISMDRGYYDEILLKDFILYLGNCFNPDELKSILTKLIGTHSKEIRHLLPQVKKFNDIFNKDSNQITNSLDKSECLQMILLLSDGQIVNAIESLIDESIIEIPATETRVMKNGFQFDTGAYDSIIQCSRYGIRSISNSKPMASIRMGKLIREIYKTPGVALLGWKLRTVKGETFYEKLDNYLHSENPEITLSNLVLDDPSHLKTALNYITFGKFDYDQSNAEEEDKIIKKILWKIGFHINIYPDYITDFWKRYKKFDEHISRYEGNYEDKQESIRSSAVNFFASLEQILGYSLSFMTWMLLSDHFGSTNFKLNLKTAQEFMASMLINAPENTQNISFDPTGKNTLYPLIEGFNILANISSNAFSNNEALKRDESEIPEYFVNHYSGTPFPFLHKMLVLDIREKDRERALGLLREITESLTRADVCSIRNRIEHSREKKDFPSRDEMNRMCKTIRYIIGEAISFGACPSVYFVTKTSIDGYDRSSLTLTDCTGREINLYPYYFNFCNLPGFGRTKPFVLVAGIHIGDSAELIRFEFEETSKYTEMWQNYPKKGNLKRET